ncbi:MAG: serine hydrolase domain-containing protein, partial [Pseudomonadota bacterium]
MQVSGKGRMMRLVFLTCALVFSSIFTLNLAVAAEEVGASETLSPAAAKTWADTLFSDAITNKRIDAAVVSVVKDGDVLFEGGYGLADVVEQRAASATTPFRSGSISKLFTAIAMLQLVEDGKVGLDDDINQHLVRAPIETVKGRTTIRHLLTHTAGFDERFRNTLTLNPGQKRATPQYMRKYAHKQVRAPGEVISYSNHGMGIAGVIIEDVTGLTYGEYIRSEIFDPLGMGNAFPEYPDALPTTIATEYDVVDGDVRPRPLRYKVPFYLGSGGFFYSARDMAMFMNAVLERSPLLLADESWTEALSLQKKAGEGLNGGIGLGFWV